MTPIIGLLLIKVAVAQTPIEEPKVRHGINPAVVERTSRAWQMAALEVSKYGVKGFPKESVSVEKFPKLIRGGKNDRFLALTFDDGPHPKYTLALIDILKRENVPATFFVVGKMGVKYPELLRAIDENGFELGNHTYSHVTLTDLKPAEASIEYQANNDVIYGTTGVRPRYCRPPGGRYDAETIKAAARLGMTTVLWTDDPGDYDKPDSSTLEKKTLAKLTNGGIILLHSGVQSTLDILPDLIHYAKAKGFRFVSLNQMEASLDRENAALIAKHRREMASAPTRPVR